mgnify:CR=1 FL=1|jgi:hypothetical protein
MTLNEIKTMADDHVECNFAEVQMYATIKIAESLHRIDEALGASTLHLLNKGEV